MRIAVGLAAVAATCLAASPARADDKAVGIVSNVKVLSDKVPDVSSMEAWKKSFIKDGMKPADKAMAVWKTVATFGLEGAPVTEYLGGGEDTVRDPIKTFNVYGCNFCDDSASMVEALGRYAGLDARGWNLHGHCVSDLFYDNAWHLLDAAYMNYFLKPDGTIASVEEIRAAVKDWYAQHPEYVGKLQNLQGGWKNGPPLLATFPLTRPDGGFPSVFGSWGTSMFNYDGGGGTPVHYEFGYHQGYQVNIQLRKGERLTRNWSFNAALPHPYLENDEYHVLGCKVGEGVLKFSPDYGDLANGRVGNGVLEYNVPLADGSFRGGALLADNVSAKDEDKVGPAVHVKDAAKPGVVVFRMPTSYLYLTGKVAVSAVVPDGGEIAVAFSDNNGLDWTDLTKIAKSGEQTIDLNEKIKYRYDYQIKFTMTGAGTGLDSLKITHDIVQSQRALPALGKGANAIAFAAGNEGTVTICGSTDPKCTQQVKLVDFHPVLTGIDAAGMQVQGRGSATFNVSTPGDMTCLRFGGFYRARDKKDGWDYKVSFDDGKTFTTVDRAAGPAVGGCKYVTYDKVPAGTRGAQVQFAGNATNTTMMFRTRIDADYKEPQGGFAPIKITYMWEENGQAKQDVHTAKTANDKYTINCASKPKMTSIIMEWAQ
jgi:hypothetical protein